MSVPVRLFSVATLLLASLAAHADTYDYSFSVSGGGTSFTYDSPVMIATNTVITPLTCDVNSGSFGPCLAVDINPTAGELDIYTTLVGETFQLAGLPQSFFQVGDNIVGEAPIFSMVELNIVDVPSAPSSVTPEPSGLVLLGTGALGLVGSLRRRFADV